MPAHDNILYARQPIYDSDLHIAGYELLFRSNESRHRVPEQFNDEAATSQVLINAFTQSNIETVCSNQPAFVNFSAETLGAYIPFSPDKLVIEVLEDVEATDAVIAALKSLRQSGYRIALDDYTRPDADHPLLPFADIVKLDYPSFTDTAFSQTATAINNAQPGVRVLAEKVETRQEFEVCRTSGCTLFQGYFLAHPEPVHGAAIPVSRLNVMQMLALLNNPDADINDLTRVARDDPALNYGLLKLANSALYYRKTTSLHMAIMALGTKRIRAYASLLALTKLQDKPDALKQLAATRGFICQTLCESLNGSPETGFTVGLFSCLEAFFDRVLEDILESVPLDDVISRALLAYEGPLGIILHSVIQHEKNQLDQIRWDDLATLGIGPEQLVSAFEEGVSQANKSMDQALAL